MQGREDEQSARLALYLTLFIEEGRRAGVGTAQQGAPRFQGAHAGNLKVLVRRQRVAEPGIVAGVDENPCRRKVAIDIPAEHILVADGHPQGHAPNRQQGLPQGAWRHVGHRDIDIVIQKADQAPKGEVLAEGHQVPLVIDLLPARAQQQHAVVIDAAVPVGIEDTGEQRGTAFPSALRQGIQKGFSQILGAPGDRRLGPQNQIHLSPQGFALAQVEVDDPLPGIGAPAHLLRDVALDHRHPQRLIDSLGPFLLLQCVASGKQQQQGGQSQDARPALEHRQQQQGGQDRQRADAVNANQRRKTRQRRIGLGVTETEPGKAGQNPALGPFHREPAQRQQGEDHPLGPATTQPLHQGQQATYEGGQG